MPTKFASYQVGSCSMPHKLWSLDISTVRDELETTSGEKKFIRMVHTINQSRFEDFDNFDVANKRQHC